MRIYNLIVGDYSKDGHGESESFLVECNKEPLIKNMYMPQKERESIVDDSPYRKGCKILGFDLIEDVCEDYNECDIHAKFLHKIKMAYPDFEHDMEPFDDEVDQEKLTDPNNRYTVEPYDWLRLILTVCKIGDNDFEYEIIKPIIYDSRSIGGYGIFTS